MKKEVKYLYHEIAGRVRCIDGFFYFVNNGRCIGCGKKLEIKEVEKMLKCDTLGFRLFSCPNCGEFELVHFGCNSRLCTHCGKRYTDNWANAVARKTFDVKHRHVVFTIPQELRSFFHEDRSLLKVLMGLCYRYSCRCNGAEIEV